jgi:hypothetical protein
VKKKFKYFILFEACVGASKFASHRLRLSLVDTIKIDLVRQFKLCIDEINTEIVDIKDKTIESYVKMNNILVNLKKI